MQLSHKQFPVKKMRACSSSATKYQLYKLKNFKIWQKLTKLYILQTIDFLQLHDSIPRL